MGTVQSQTFVPARPYGNSGQSPQTQAYQYPSETGQTHVFQTQVVRQTERQTAFDPVDVVQARVQASEVQPNLVGIWIAFTILRIISIVSHQCIDY